MIQVVIFTSTIAVLWGIRCLLEAKKNDVLKSELSVERRRRRLAESEVTVLKLRVAMLSAVIGQGSVNQDIKDAVHYAMVHAHPDNGGKQEDFIRFRKCYEQISV